VDAEKQNARDVVLANHGAEALTGELLGVGTDQADRVVKKFVYA
jgi:hypothetical protein